MNVNDCKESFDPANIRHEKSHVAGFCYWLMDPMVKKTKKSLMH